MYKTVDVVIADDHALVRKGLRQVLEAESFLTIFEAENGISALNLIREKKPQIAVLDIDMPGLSGFELAETVQREALPVTVIFLTMYREQQTFNRAIDSGVMGYVLKENTISEIVDCVNAVLNGNYYISPSLSDFLIRRNTKSLKGSPGQNLISCLTPAEKKLLRLLSEMKTNQEIADTLNISIKTIYNHRNNICDKLGLRGVQALLKFSVENSQLF